MAKERVAGVEKENVLIRAGNCSVTLLPEFGGKIASLCVNHQELLQAPLAPVAPRTQTLPFDASDASGWDECVPAVAACTVATAAGPAEVPDHGDLWRAVWETTAASEGSATLRGACFSLPLALERTITLEEESSKSWHMRLVYKVTNTGTFAAPWSWAAHALFASKAGDQIVLPSTIHTLRLEGSGGQRLGKNGDQVNWPVATLTDGSRTDLSVAQPPESGIGDKLFTGPLGEQENWCELVRPSAGLRIRVSFDQTATPYLGLWICHGGWPDRPGPKQTCVAMEPSTAPVDSLAETGPWSRVLKAGESYSWPMHVHIQAL